MPTAIRLVTGNRGKRALNADEPIVEAVTTLDPPPNLTPAEIVAWHDITGKLATLGTLNEADSHLLTISAKAWAEYQEADKRVREGGLLIAMPGVGRLPRPAENPLIRVRDRNRATLIKLLPEFGLSPSSRSQVKGGQPKSKLDAFLGMHRRKAPKRA